MEEERSGRVLRGGKETMEEDEKFMISHHSF